MFTIGATNKAPAIKAVPVFKGLTMNEQQMKDYKKKPSLYHDIEPTWDGMWCIRGGDVVSDLKRAVLIRDGVLK